MMEMSISFGNTQLIGAHALFPGHFQASHKRGIGGWDNHEVWNFVSN